MIFTLSIFINLALIIAVYALYVKGTREYKYLDEYCARNALSTRQYFERLFPKPQKPKDGLLEKAIRRAAVAEKLADRAFSLASTASLGVLALQKTLAVRPRIVSEDQRKRNELAKAKLDELFGNSGGFEWFRPILSDEELDVLDKAQAHLDQFGNKK